MQGRAGDNLRHALSAQGSGGHSYTMRVRREQQRNRPATSIEVEIGHVMEIEMSKGGIVNAVYRARGQGMTWTAIGLILGESTNAVTTKYGYLDKFLTEGTLPSEPEPVTKPEIESGQVDITTFRTMTDEELLTIVKDITARVSSASRERRNLKDARSREAAIVVLYERDFTAKRIGDLVGLSNQRIIGLVNRYYNRIEKEWEAQRAK